MRVLAWHDHGMTRGGEPPADRRADRAAAAGHQREPATVAACDQRPSGSPARPCTIASRPVAMRTSPLCTVNEYDSVRASAAAVASISRSPRRRRGARGGHRSHDRRDDPGPRRASPEPRSAPCTATACPRTRSRSRRQGAPRAQRIVRPAVRAGRAPVVASSSARSRRAGSSRPGAAVAGEPVAIERHGAHTAAPTREGQAVQVLEHARGRRPPASCSSGSARAAGMPLRSRSRRGRRAARWQARAVSRRRAAMRRVGAARAPAPRRRRADRRAAQRPGIGRRRRSAAPAARSSATRDAASSRPAPKLAS